MRAIGENTVLAQRYTLTRKLAGRADQELWIATDATLGREVTATVFPADFDHAEAALDSARRAAGVEDRHLPRVLDVGRENGTAYVITEALHGAESIAAALQFDPLPPEEVRRMVGEAASGLGAASARGLHHLQLTPHDIVSSPDGAVSVLGLPTDAALAGADDLSSEDASRADTVALVQIVYAGLTRRWPGEESVPGLQNVSRRADGELPSPSELVPGVPGDLDTLCRTTLGADEGPRTPGELARQLAPWSSERVTTSTRRTTGSGGKSAATLQAVPGGDRSGTKPPAAPGAPVPSDDTDGAGHTPTGGAAPVKTALPKGGVASAAGPASEVDNSDETAQISRATLERARERTAVPPDVDDDYDPSYAELEPPVPGLVGHGYEPDSQSSRLALLLVGLLVIIAVIFAAIGLHGLGGSSSPDEAASSGAASPSASGSKSSSAPARSSKPKPTAKPLTIERTTSYGINGGENSGLAANATDGDPGSYWNSFDYNTADGRGGGQGTGILLNLGTVKSVKDVKITTTGGPSTIKFYVSDVIEPVSTRQPEATLTGSGTQTAHLDGADAKYITIWVTQLSKQDDGKFQERINDVKVYP
ncbi:MAG TPA: protein kinase family protein [Flexivirga sp.]|uniref:protein kinase family protein n=1 Tax=Flexivirga sp. TaxID=1962927 RepID=UPI002B921377|nr:protein kinase family protein [Flexivirga sp.]HWC22691.1 protein kinase family protein [Flexivirga sp.]